MTKAFPRLLVATEFPPNASGGGPAVVRQMLRDWPAETISWWSCLPEADQKFGQKVAAHHVTGIPQKLYPHRRFGRQKSWVLENIWAPWATRHFKKVLQTIRPDVVWVIPHSWSIPPLAGVLPGSKLGFHVSIHDYADCGSWCQLFGPGPTSRLLAQADRLYASSTTRDAICQPMVDDLRQRTGQTGVVARAGLEKEDFARLQSPAAEHTGPIRIAYAGTIQVQEAFELIVPVLAGIRSQLPRPVSLEFFGSHSYRACHWFDPSWMKENGNLPAPDLALALQQCDWGFSPMALTDEDPRYNHFSLPTKFVSYLGAGLPVITLGHPESSVVKMAAAYNVGICFQTTDKQSLASQLLAELTRPNPSRRFREAILHCAETEFNASRMRSRFYESLQKCALVGPPV